MQQVIHARMCTYSIIAPTNFRVHLAKVVHDAVQVQLSSTEYNMFSRFLNLQNETPLID